MKSLDTRLQHLERLEVDRANCTEPNCKHMELLRMARRANGVPEYPLPPHPMNPPAPPKMWLIDAIASLNRLPGESAEAHAERTKPKPFIDPMYGEMPPLRHEHQPEVTHAHNS